MNDKNFRNRLTPELMDAMDTVCGACPYISEACDSSEIVEAAYTERYDDAGEKYCEPLILLSGKLSSTTRRGAHHIYSRIFV